MFERGQKIGLTSALMTAKKKTQSLLRSGAQVRLAAEAPQDAEGSDIDWVDRLGPPPDIYSPEINHWLFRAARIVLDSLEAEGELTVGENEPYKLSHTRDYSIPVHGEVRGLPHVEFEIRQDLVATAGGQAAWAERLAPVLREGLERLGT